MLGTFGLETSRAFQYFHGEKAKAVNLVRRSNESNPSLSHVWTTQVHLPSFSHLRSPGSQKM